MTIDQDHHFSMLCTELDFLCRISHLLYSVFSVSPHGISPSYIAETLHQYRITPSTPLRINIDTTRADLATNHTWRSSISSGRGAGLECSADVCQNY